MPNHCLFSDKTVFGIVYYSNLYKQIPTKIFKNVPEHWHGMEKNSMYCTGSFFGTFWSNFQCSKMKYVMTEIKCLISELYLAKCKQSYNIGKDVR